MSVGSRYEFGGKWRLQSRYTQLAIIATQVGKYSREQKRRGKKIKG